MATKRLICAAAILSGLLGCATPRSLTAVNCNGGSCNVDVHVDNCTITAPNIDNYGSNNIFWTLDTSSRQAGYTFPDETVHLGIWLKSPPPTGSSCNPAGGVFDSPQRQTDWKFKLHNSGIPGVYCYGVMVVQGSTTCPPLDPQINNH